MKKDVIDPMTTATILAEYRNLWGRLSEHPSRVELKKAFARFGLDVSYALWRADAARKAEGGAA